MDRDWFEMRAIRRRRLENSVWVPLRQSERNTQGEFGQEGNQEEFMGAGSVLVPQPLRDQGEKLNWSDIGLGHEQGPIVYGENYIVTDIYQIRDGEDLGVEPVLVQSFSGSDPTIWHLNQDIVFALGLLREGDVWVRPDEAYTEVVRLRRNGKGQPILMEMKAEFLKDYLSARNMVLRVSRYFSRLEVVENSAPLGWDEGVHVDDADENRFEIRVTKIHEGGHFFGEEAAVFHVSRNDIDPVEDVPVMGPENDGNVDFSSWTTKFKGRPLYRVHGEFWIDEWIEPAAFSPRVRRDDVPSSCEFIIEASGEKANADTLNDEDVGRWLWFRNDVVEAVSAQRGAAFNWYTRDTGNITPCPGYSVHFGINELQLITVYAHDIACLPEWQRRFWAGYNISPEGGVSEELLASQARAKPASTKAPEEYFATSFELLDKAVEARWGTKLFRDHHDVDKIMLNIHRFRAKDRAGLLSLAKDISRLTADRMNVDLLHSVAPPPKGEKRASLKSLEFALATIIDKESARSALTPLVGVYELRLGDAHLPSSQIEEALGLVPVTPDVHPIQQGFQMIEAVVIALQRIAKTLLKDSEEESRNED